MAGNRTFTVTVRINADGSSAGREIKKVEGSLDSFGKATKVTEKQLKAAGVELRSTAERFKAFAATVQAAVVSTVAAVGTVAVAFREFKRAAAIDAQTEAFERNLAKQGIALDDFLAKTKAAADGQIAQADRVAASSRALLLGIPADKIADLLEIARARSVALGTDVGKAFDDLTLGLARKSIPILDNLGFTMNSLKASTDDYAESIGKATDELTEQERGAALLNAVLTQGKQDVEDFGDAQGDAARAIGKFTAAVKDLRDGLGKTATTAIPNFLRGLRAISKETPGAGRALGIYADAVRKLGRAWVFVQGVQFQAIQDIITIGRLEKEAADATASAAKNRETIARRRLDELAAETDALFAKAKAEEESEKRSRELVDAFRDLIEGSEDWQKATEEATQETESQTSVVIEAAKTYDNTVTSVERMTRAVNDYTLALQGASRQMIVTIQDFVDFERQFGRAAAEAQALADGAVVEGGRLRLPGGGRRLIRGDRDALFPGLSGAAYTYTERRSAPTAHGGVRFF